MISDKSTDTNGAKKTEDLGRQNGNEKEIAHTGAKCSQEKQGIVEAVRAWNQMA